MRNFRGKCSRWDEEAGRQKATATCEATFEEVEKKTGTKERKRSGKGCVCVVGDGGEKAMRSQKGSCWMQKPQPPVGLSFGLDLG